MQRVELIIKVVDYADSLITDDDTGDEAVAKEVSVAFQKFAEKLIGGTPDRPPLRRQVRPEHTVEDEIDLKTPVPPVPEIESATDKLKFMMANKHLERKKVKGETDDGVEVSGIVTGLDSPFIVVKNDNGYFKLHAQTVKVLGG